MTHPPAALAAAFRRQAGYCTDLGSPLWAAAMGMVAADIESGGAFGRFLARWDGDIERGILPLRLFGGLHYLALDGRAPGLARQLPSTGGSPDDGLWPALLATLDAEQPALDVFLDRPPQTNEVGRSAIFLGGFLEIAALSSLPLALREVGASAGLNLLWDRFAYQLGRGRWAGRDPVLTIATDWQGPAPRLDLQPVVADRRACDRQPIDLADPEARLRLQGYVWPDHLDRLATLRAAMTLALAMGVEVETADALDWTRRELARRPAGQAMVIYHSVVLQYFSAAEQAELARMLAAAGAAATPETPLAWLAYEFPSPKEELELSLTYWPGGERRRLAVAQAHGRWVKWMG
jgi:hypothetical protein